MQKIKVRSLLRKTILQKLCAVGAGLTADLVVTKATGSGLIGVVADVVTYVVVDDYMDSVIEVDETL